MMLCSLINLEQVFKVTCMLMLDLSVLCSVLHVVLAVFLAAHHQLVIEPDNCYIQDSPLLRYYITQGTARTAFFTEIMFLYYHFIVHVLYNYLLNAICSDGCKCWCDVLTINICITFSLCYCSKGFGEQF